MINPEIDKYGTKRWLNEKGEYHREDGPAVESINGNKYWYINGKKHRLDGPAAEYDDGDKWWYIDGKRINITTQEEFEQYLRLKGFW